MALGLDGLGKRRGPTSKAGLGKVPRAKASGGKVAERFAPAQANIPGRRIHGNGARVDEWLDTHDEPLFWIDLSEDSQLGRLQDRLVYLEERLQSLIQTPIVFLRNLFSCQK